MQYGISFDGYIDHPDNFYRLHVLIMPGFNGEDDEVLTAFVNGYPMFILERAYMDRTRLVQPVSFNHAQTIIAVWTLIGELSEDAMESFVEDSTTPDGGLLADWPRRFHAAIDRFVIGEGHGVTDLVDRALKAWT